MTPPSLSPWTRRGAAALAALATLLISASALAQTWTGGRTTPSLAEMFAIDATGEPNWIYGFEDLAGDGETFQQQEKNIDIRTAYASTSPQQVFVRTYISDTAGPGGNTSVYVFIDSDKNSSTGGTAAATNIDPKFTGDSSPGGYEYVVGLRGNESVLGVWQWDGAAWATVNITATQVVAEVGTDTDPIRINENVHGYIQGMIELGLVGLTEACNANLYVRSSNDNASLGAGDLEVGQVGGCVPTDNNNNGIPDPIENPVDNCTNDDQCVGDGICQNGICVLPRPCVDNTDCASGEQCTADGRCVPIPTGSCTTNAECSGGTVCVGGQCGACTQGGSECDQGFVCAPTGRCIEDVGPGAEFEDVQGGACSCSIPGNSKTGSLLALALIPLAFAARRISRRQARF
jgi:hypothetical protein